MKLYPYHLVVCSIILPQFSDVTAKPLRVSYRLTNKLGADTSELPQFSDVLGGLSPFGLANR